MVVRGFTFILDMQDLSEPVGQLEQVTILHFFEEPSFIKQPSARPGVWVGERVLSTLLPSPAGARRLRHRPAAPHLGALRVCHRREPDSPGVPPPRVLSLPDAGPQFPRFCPSPVLHSVSVLRTTHQQGPVPGLISERPSPFSLYRGLDSPAALGVALKGLRYRPPPPPPAGPRNRG